MTSSGGSSSSLRIAVVGAGVVGLACAARLQMRGHAVTLVDPRDPGSYCSSGNAGCLSRASCVPLGLPGTWKKVPKWLVDPEGPLVIRPGYALRVMPWLWRFRQNSTLERVNPIADALHTLLDVTIARWRPLAAWAGVPELIRQDGYAFAYRSESAFAADALGRELRLARGVKVEVHTGGTIREIEPALAPETTHLVLLPEQGHTPNPLRLSQALAARLRAGGATFVNREATGFDMVAGRVARVVTAQGAIDADAVVICAGAHSNALSSQLGADLPLETERGYHAMLASASVVPRMPVGSGEGKWFATPMEGGLRVAGAVEFAGLSAPPRYERADVLVAGAKRLLPGLRHGAVERWMGHRPSMPDSMPVIGCSPAAANAYFAFGHGHTGLTGAPATAEIVEALVCGERPAIDPRPFAAERFRSARSPDHRGG